jgi:DNA-binding LacI/PurR family transcriptional regulator
VGIDDHEYAEMFGLTTLEQVPREQGAAAVELLLRQIDDPEQPPSLVRLHARLIMRTSTAPPNGTGSATFLDSAVGDESDALTA